MGKSSCKMRAVCADPFQATIIFFFILFPAESWRAYVPSTGQDHPTALVELQVEGSGGAWGKAQGWCCSGFQNKIEAVANLMGFANVRLKIKLSCSPMHLCFLDANDGIFALRVKWSECTSSRGSYGEAGGGKRSGITVGCKRRQILERIGQNLDSFHVLKPATGHHEIALVLPGLSVGSRLISIQLLLVHDDEEREGEGCEVGGGTCEVGGGTSSPPSPSTPSPHNSTSLHTLTFALRVHAERGEREEREEREKGELPAGHPRHHTHPTHPRHHTHPTHPHPTHPHTTFAHGTHTTDGDTETADGDNKTTHTSTTTLAEGSGGAAECRRVALSALLGVSRLNPQDLLSYVCVDKQGRHDKQEPVATEPTPHPHRGGGSSQRGRGASRSEGVGGRVESEGGGSGSESGRGCGEADGRNGACDHDIREALSYMPSLAQLRSVSVVAACSVDGDGDRVDLMHRLSRLLNTEDCQRAVAAPLPGYGFAATFHYGVLQLGRALQGRLAISFAGYFLYAAPHCQEASMACVFHPPSRTCHPRFSEAKLTDLENAAELSEAWWVEREQTLSLDDEAAAAVDDGFFACCAARHRSVVDCVSRAALYSLEIHERCGERNPRWLPPEYAPRKGSFWFRSLLAAYLFAPLPEYLGHFRRELEPLIQPRLYSTPNAHAHTHPDSVEQGEGGEEAACRGERGAWEEGGGGIIGVHIRRGDACHTPVGIQHNQHCVPTHKYVEAIRNMRSNYPGMTRVFLSTNGGVSVVSELQAALPDMHVILQNIPDRSKYACCEKEDLNCSAGPGCLHTDERLRSAGGADPHHANEIVTDILGLSSCDALVGTMTSQVLRLALELSYFWRGYLVPYQSLDIPWCWEGYNRKRFTVANRSFEYGC